jgi:putative oxidoreductase
MSVGLLILRLAVGLTIAAHGAQKLFGWFGGHGLKGTSSYFEMTGLRPGLPNALVAGLAEGVGGLLLASGLLTPLGVAALVGMMAAAIMFVHLRQGFFAQNGGFEYPFMLGLVGAALAFTGPGAYSLDAALGWSLHSTPWALGSIVVGLAAAAAVGVGREVYNRWSPRQNQGGHTPAGRAGSPTLA